ncbi:MULTISPECIES: YfcC family protein [Pasteurellaceae]|uniref:YfcC family protein n=1 Tax=Pasteurella atlantica TaxID=2827233 RepID=A0AAW8CKB0_9PAST|nr:YfcC family protein [Pasteurella atlantica]MBR0574525.1 YfcC family protein [Pasteurella atlantica]MDP8040392.1 YfcC family protein [Pasteurella atlantica]MDP8042558.1 YfcC family protein [Pasteurella atlantica]MDP8044662.1 YfcC family protein [Pasteurella atlantica]MDP8046709.1 YfcC family protein [Pasteurella atlantica]
MTTKKKGFKFPTAFTILFAIIIIAVGLTWIIPAGAYSKLTYDKAQNVFVIKKYQQEDKILPATEKTLKELNINIDIGNITSGKIWKPIAVPGSYTRVEQNPKGIQDIAISMVKGTIEAADIMVFIFVLGGMIGVINKTGSFAAGLSALAERTKGKEFTIVFAVCVLMAIGGTTCGIEEEAVAFYPILAPVFIALGYDAIITVGAIFLAASMGTAFSTINPFSVVIASDAAGIAFTEGITWRSIGLVIGEIMVISYLYWYAKKIKADPTSSIVYEEREKFYHTYRDDSNTEIPAFTFKRKLILALFCAGFPIMIWGVMYGGWWFPTMAASFLTITIIIMFISGLCEEDIINAFNKGASELVAVSLIIGLARGVNMILDQGMVSDTILASLSDMVSGMSGSVFIIGQLLVFVVLGLFVPSSSGLAVLSMPIMAPLADTVGIPRDIIVSAYNWGQYIMLFLAPTGLVLVTLQMLHIPFNKWVRFIMPMVGGLFIISSILLLIQVQLYA